MISLPSATSAVAPCWPLTRICVQSPLLFFLSYRSSIPSFIVSESDEVVLFCNLGLYPTPTLAGVGFPGSVSLNSGPQDLLPCMFCEAPAELDDELIT